MDDKKLIKYINVSSRIDTDILISQLHAAGIETIVKSPGAGEYLNILGYGSAHGQDVYVTLKDCKVAMESAKKFKTTDSKELGRIRRIRLIFAILILVGFVAGFVMTFLF